MGRVCMQLEIEVSLIAATFTGQLPIANRSKCVDAAWVVSLSCNLAMCVVLTCAYLPVGCWQRWQDIPAIVLRALHCAVGVQRLGWHREPEFMVFTCLQQPDVKFDPCITIALRRSCSCYSWWKTSCTLGYMNSSLKAGKTAFVKMRRCSLPELAGESKRLAIQNTRLPLGTGNNPQPAQVRLDASTVAHYSKWKRFLHAQTTARICTDSVQSLVDPAIYLQIIAKTTFNNYRL